jgi:hypothetical protein
MLTSKSKLLAKIISNISLPFADLVKGLFWSRVSSHEGLSPLSGPKTNDELRQVELLTLETKWHGDIEVSWK